MNNNKQQTAVEWLYHNLFPKQLDGFSEEEWSKIDKAFNQAKELEKQQIIDACQQGFYDGVDLAKIKKSEFKSAQEYYNETFNTKEK